MSDDLFEDAPDAPKASYPTVKQLATGDKTVNVVYAKGKDNEVVKDTAGRLLIFRPTSKPERVPDTMNKGKFKDQMKVDVILLSGPPITETVDKDGEVTGKIDPPLVPGDVIPEMFMSNLLVVGQLRQLGNGEPIGRMTVGRFFQLPPKNTGGNKSWVIGQATDPKQKAADLKAAGDWVKAHPAPSMFD